jgi:hypothetical protein
MVCVQGAKSVIRWVRSHAGSEHHESLLISCRKLVVVP